MKLNVISILVVAFIALCSAATLPETGRIAVASTPAEASPANADGAAAADAAPANGTAVRQDFIGDALSNIQSTFQSFQQSLPTLPALNIPGLTNTNTLSTGGAATDAAAPAAPNLVESITNIFNQNPLTNFIQDAFSNITTAFRPAAPAAAAPPKATENESAQPATTST